MSPKGDNLEADNPNPNPNFIKHNINWHEQHDEVTARPKGKATRKIHNEFITFFGISHPRFSTNLLHWSC